MDIKKLIFEEKIDMQINFSWRAAVIFVLAMLPNVIYFIAPPNDIPKTLGSKVKIVEFIENISRIIAFALLLFVAQNQNPSLKSAWVIGIIIFMGLYYILWIRYFIEGSSYALLGKSLLGIPSPMAIFPICCFICASFWLNCLPAVIAFVIFGIAHIISLL